MRLSSRRGSQEGRRSEQRWNIQQPPRLGGEQANGGGSTVLSS